METDSDPRSPGTGNGLKNWFSASDFHSSDQNPPRLNYLQISKVVYSNTFAEAETAVTEAPRKVSRK